MGRKFKLRRRYNRPRLEEGKEYEGIVGYYTEGGDPVVLISPTFRVIVNRFLNKPRRREKIKYTVGRVYPNFALATLVEDSTKGLTAIIEKDYREALRSYGVGNDVPITDINKIISPMWEAYGKENKVLQAIKEIQGNEKKRGYLHLSSFLNPWNRKDVSNLDKLCYKMFELIWRTEDKELNIRNYNITNDLSEIMILRDNLGFGWEGEKLALGNLSIDMKIGRFDGIPDGSRILGYLVDDSSILDGEPNPSFKIELFDLDRKWDEKEVQRIVDEFASQSGIIIANVIRKKAYISTSSEESARKMFDMLKGD